MKGQSLNDTMWLKVAVCQGPFWKWFCDDVIPKVSEGLHNDKYSCK